MARRPTGSIFVNLHRKVPTVGARFRYRGERVYVTLGKLDDWPPERAWKHIHEIQRDIDAGLELGEVEQRWRKRERRSRARRPVKDPPGEIYASLRVAAQHATRFQSATSSRRLRLLADDLVVALHAAEDRARQLVNATYELPDADSFAGADVRLRGVA